MLQRYYRQQIVLESPRFCLFYDTNSCVRYRVSTTWLLYLTLVCLYWLPFLIICTNICYNLLSFIIINGDNVHPAGAHSTKVSSIRPNTIRTAVDKHKIRERIINGSLSLTSVNEGMEIWQREFELSDIPVSEKYQFSCAVRHRESHIFTGKAIYYCKCFACCLYHVFANALSLPMLCFTTTSPTNIEVCVRFGYHLYHIKLYLVSHNISFPTPT